MAKTATKDKTATETPQQPPAPQLPATIQPRIAYPRSVQEAFGIGPSEWLVLIDVIFPSATSAASIVLALRYCRARNLDVMKKMVHIVPMYSKALDKTVDTIWPGIAEVRVTATRTNVYAGRDAEKYGPMVKKALQHVDDRNGTVKKTLDIEFPEWCELTVYKIVAGIRCAFVGPKVYWEEAYATESRYSKIPNEMWQDRKHGQIGKCAEAAALRAAFPEETGGQLTAEEMHGRVVEGQINPDNMVVQDGTLVPPRPKESDFANKDKPAHDKPKAKTSEPDGRPEPPPIGEQVQQTGKLPDPEIPDSLRRQPEPEPEPEDDTAPSEAYMAASNLMDALEEKMPNVPDLDVFKKEGRANIEAQPGMTDEERDMLRGRFTTICLAEQKRRAKR